MSLFDKKRSVVALGDDAIQSIRNELNSVLGIARSFDELMAKSGDLVISLEGRIRGDRLAFTLYLSGINRGVDPREIQVVNSIFDIDLSHVDFQIFSKDVSSRNFERSVPPSILILKEMGMVLQRETTTNEDGITASEAAERGGVTNMATKLPDDLINLYALVGSAFISADSQISKRESNDLCRYLYMMKRAVSGYGAELPEGPAQQVVLGHVRLFGRGPKID